MVPGNASAESSDVNEPQVNVDHFYHRPTHNVVGLLTDKSEIPAISSDLAAAGVDVAALEILCGDQGARILDEDGRTTGGAPGSCEPCSGSDTTGRP